MSHNSGDGAHDMVQDTPIRRIRNRVWLTIIAVTSTLAAVGGFVVANSVGESPKSAFDKADRKITVTTPAEFRVVDAGVTFSGKVVAGSRTAISPVVLPEQAVVSRQILKTGDTVHPGSLLGAIAGFPSFALVGTIPLYRELRAGDRGDDVRALQAAMSRAGLIRSLTGQVDDAMLVATERLFIREGYTIPQESVAKPTKKDPDAKEYRRVIPASSFIGLSKDKLEVVSVAHVNTRIQEGHPLLTVQTSQDAVVFRVSPDQAAAFETGVQVAVRTSTKTLEGTVTSVGEFKSGGDGQVPGRDIRVRADSASLEQAGVGAAVTVSAEGATKAGLAVPTVAIREDASGSYVLVLAQNNRRNRVEVNAISFGGGWTAVTSKALRRGDSVITS